MTQPQSALDFDKLKWVEVSLPRINWDEALQELREHISENPGGDELDYFGKDGK